MLFSPCVIPRPLANQTRLGGIPLTRLHRDDIDRLTDLDAPPPMIDERPRGRHQRRSTIAHTGSQRVRPRHRADGRESFKCGRCRAFIGPTVSGGHHRNHCPLCLTSRHVDARRPGDRASPCRALMAPVGTFFKPKGEQVVVHRCNGCGIERRNRVAADDNPLALLRLAPVTPQHGVRQRADDEAIA